MKSLLVYDFHSGFNITKKAPWTTVFSDHRLSPFWTPSPGWRSSCWARVSSSAIAGVMPLVHAAALPTPEFQAMATPSFIISHAMAALKRQMGSVGAQLPWLPEQTGLLCSAPIHFQESNSKKKTQQLLKQLIPSQLRKMATPTNEAGQHTKLNSL